MDKRTWTTLKFRKQHLESKWKCSWICSCGNFKQILGGIRIHQISKQKRTDFCFWLFGGSFLVLSLFLPRVTYRKLASALLAVGIVREVVVHFNAHWRRKGPQRLFLKENTARKYTNLNPPHWKLKFY